MKTYIALLRGINVGGHKKFPKADQLLMLQKLGLKNPQVYIHTGNWIFNTEAKATAISRQISEEILEQYGWEVPVIVISKPESQKILDNSPFNLEKKEKSYFALLADTPSAENSAVFNQLSYPEEEFYLTDRCVYFYSTISAARVKMNNNLMEKKLKISATSRNYNTMVKLLKMMED